jgi:hypothetical protein
MSMRISDRRLGGLTLALVSLAGCGEQPASDPFPDSGTPPDRIECRIGAHAAFDRVCTVERLETPEGLILTVRHPDGGFRRLRVTNDGQGVVSADGAEAARVTITADTQIEVAIAGDAYRLPATVKPGARAGTGQ